MRGNGATTRQIENAPHGAVFVWCNGDLSYPKHIAHKLGRGDLEIVSPLWLESPQRWAGRILKGVVIDHACLMTDKQFKGYAEIKIRATRYGFSVE